MTEILTLCFHGADEIENGTAEAFNAIDQRPLTSALCAPLACGVYGLFLKGKVVYIGKATTMPMRRRLRDHERKLANRVGITPDDVAYVALAVPKAWMAMAYEQILIDHFHPNWNASGFGCHSLGKTRTRRRECRWEGEYPKLEKKCETV